MRIFELLLLDISLTESLIPNLNKMMAMMMTRKKMMAMAVVMMTTTMMKMMMIRSSQVLSVWIVASFRVVISRRINIHQLILDRLVID